MSQTQESEMPTFESLWTLENVNSLKNEFILRHEETQFCFASVWFHQKVWWWPANRRQIQKLAKEFLYATEKPVRVGNLYLFGCDDDLLYRQIRLQFLDWEIARLEKLRHSASDLNTNEE